jgi:hypothetical protein
MWCLFCFTTYFLADRFGSKADQRKLLLAANNFDWKMAGIKAWLRHHGDEKGPLFFPHCAKRHK